MWQGVGGEGQLWVQVSMLGWLWLCEEGTRLHAVSGVVMVLVPVIAGGSDV